MIKKIYIFLIIILSFTIFLLYFLPLKLENEPKINIIKNYKTGNYIFSDRDYINHLNNEKLVGLSLIQIPRHYYEKIEIEIFDKIDIYRILCEKNNRKSYINWEQIDYTVNIIGISCIHDDVVKKTFDKGIIYLLPGGPISTDPIFIDNKSNNKINFNIKIN